MRFFVWKSILLLSCTLALTLEQGWPLFPSALGFAQAAEPRNQSPQDGSIKTCTDQRIDLGAPQLTDVDLKVLTRCSSGVMPQLLEALKAQDWKVKVIAAHTLALFGTKAQSAIPTLSNLIRDENADIRFAAAQVLGEIGTEAVVPALTTALQDKDENVRVSAAIAFQKIGSAAKQAKPELIAALWDGNWYVRSRAAATISKLGLDEKDIPDLLQPWKYGYRRGWRSEYWNVLKPHSEDIISLMIVLDSNVRDQVQNGSFSAQEISDFFPKALQNGDPKIRESAAIALGNISESIRQEAVLTQNAKALLRGSEDRNSKVRQRAIEAFEKFRSSDLRKPEIAKIQIALMKGLGDSEADVRSASIESIDRFLEKSILSQDVISSLLDDQDSRVREKALFLLERLQSEAASSIPSTLIPYLIRILQNRNSNIELRRSAIGGLRVLSSSAEREQEKIIDLLNKELLSSELVLRIDAVLALQSLRKLDTKTTLTFLLEGLRSSNSSIRLDSIKGLENLCSGDSLDKQRCLDEEVAVPILIDALTDSTKAVRYASAFALARIQRGEMHNLEIFRRILKEETDPLLIGKALAAIDHLSNSAKSSFLPEIAQFQDKEIRYSFNNDCQSVKRASPLDTSGNGVLELFKGLDDENTRFTYAFTLDFNFSELLKDFTRDGGDRNPYYIYKNSSYQEKITIDQLLFTQQKLGINQLTQILNGNDSQYQASPILRDTLKLKNLDLKRSAVYVMGGIGEGIDIMESTKNPREKSQVSEQRLQLRKGVIETLMKLIWNPNEDQDLKWMAASALQRMEINIDDYFSKNYLTNPRFVKTIILHDDYQLPGKPALRFDIYSSQFIYAANAPCGGGLSEIYYALRNLLNKPKK